MRPMPTTSDAKRDHWKQSWNYGMTPEDLAEYCTKKGHRWVKRHTPGGILRSWDEVCDN